MNLYMALGRIKSMWLPSTDTPLFTRCRTRPFRLKGALKRCMTGLIDLGDLGNPGSKMTKAPKKKRGGGLSSSKKG